MLNLATETAHRSSHTETEKKCSEEKHKEKLKKISQRFSLEAITRFVFILVNCVRANTLKNAIYYPPKEQRSHPSHFHH